MTTTTHLDRDQIWRNDLGIELTLTEPVYTIGGHTALPGLWRAELRDDLFGTTYYVVTADTLRASGYQPTEEDHA